MKKSQTLGKVITKNAMKKIKGGDGRTELPPGGETGYCETRDCNSKDDCTNGSLCYNCGSEIGGKWGVCDKG